MNTIHKLNQTFRSNIKNTLQINTLLFLAAMTIYSLGLFSAKVDYNTHLENNKLCENTKYDSNIASQILQNNNKWEGKKYNGKNEPHRNVAEKIKKTNHYENAKNEYETLKSKPNKSKQEAKLCRNLKQKVCNMQKEANRKGETHWRRGK